jgi:phosphohistidine phosphatase
LKTLVIIRHAKSSWDDIDLMDINRPLNKRGRHDAPIIAKNIKQKIAKVDLILSSPAVRALSTAEYMAAEFEYPENEIQIKREIYENGFESLLKLIQTIDDSVNVAFWVGHNPVISLLASNLLGKHIESIPTCGTIGISFDVDSWSKVDFKFGKKLFFEYPKK